MLDEFRLVQRFRVPFADIDMLHHANNVAYIRWAETVRTDYFADVLVEKVGGERGMILAQMSIAYEKQIAYREYVAVGGRVAKIGGKSFRFLSEVWSTDRDERCATIDCTLVAYDYVTKQTILVPEAWRAKIAAFEGTPVEAAS